MADPVTRLNVFTRPRNPCSPRFSPQSGFSIVEMLVAALLLAISASAAFTLFSASQTLFKQDVKDRDAEQNAINADLAKIQLRNRRFTCMQGSCTLSDFDPNEDQYTPDHPDEVPLAPSDPFNAQMDEFVNLCVQPASDPSGLLQAFRTTALDTLDEMTSGVDRVIDIATPSRETPATPHAYVVTYRKDGQVLRRVRLVPTVAGWCP